jgi:hypothetical protein
MSEAEIIQSLREALRGSHCYGRVNTETIKAAESLLKITFPRSYRLFLSELGASYGGQGFEIFGLAEEQLASPSSTEPPEWSSVVQETLSARKTSRGHIPSSYIRIASDGMDCSFYLDTSLEDQEGECPVIAIGPGRDNERCAKSFLAFVAGEA